MQKITKTGKVLKDISILIYGNTVINELSLRQRAVINFRDKSDPARDTGRQTSFPDCPGHSGMVGNGNPIWSACGLG